MIELPSDTPSNEIMQIIECELREGRWIETGIYPREDRWLICFKKEFNKWHYQ